MGHWQQVVESSLSKLGLSSLILSEFNDQNMLLLEPNTPRKFRVSKNESPFSMFHVTNLLCSLPLPGFNEK